MNKYERVQMVQAMEFIARQLNDEAILEVWMTNGVADGDIPYRQLRPASTATEELEDYFNDDEDFAELMDTFLWCMRHAFLSGGLYCDGVVSHQRLAESEDEQ